MNVHTLKQNNIILVIVSAITAILALTLMTLLSPAKASAATITVGGACTLDDAVASMNAASDQSGCTGVGLYGTDDTVTLPAGTYPYANADKVEVPLTVQGAGMGETIIDCGGNNEGLTFVNPGVTPMSATVKGLSILNPDDGIGPYSAAIGGQGFAMVLREIEIYSDTPQQLESVVALNMDIDGLNADIEDVYIHDIDAEQGALHVYVKDGATSVDNVINHVTIENYVSHSVTSGMTIGIGAYDNGGSIEAEVTNSTFSNISASLASNMVYVISISDALIGSGARSVDTDVRNITIVSNDTSGTAHVPVVSVAMAPGGESANSAVSFQNILATGVASIGMAVEVGLGGTESASIGSQGGNIIDGINSPYLSHPSDQSGVTNIASTLGPLQNNGGLTPTMALLADSPAIDTGVSNSLSVDQRGVSRPQGAAFDSGAYEYASATSENSSSSGSGSNGPANELADTGQDITIIRVLSVFLIVMPLVLAGMANRKRIYKLR